MSVDLKVDFCSHEAAKYAVEHWHYTGKIPTGKLSYIGAWEDDQYIGSVVFGRGATPSIGKPYGLNMTQVAELQRVALRDHKTPVSKILVAAMSLLKKRNDGLRLLVSYADTTQGHHGGIYQASNWIYVGITEPSKMYLAPDGKTYHSRSISPRGYVRRDRPNGEMFAKAWKPSDCEIMESLGKHKYLYPLDKAMRRQIEPLSKPYPKRADVGEMESR